MTIRPWILLPALALFVGACCDCDPEEAEEAPAAAEEAAADEAPAEDAEEAPADEEGSEEAEEASE